ncbi:unnamed protein product [Ostreobium quekettii]|uniref:Cyclin C-terminal domain-containing protein n=1 Tax=Ostreobium quekettii TaxID=121088 RepID=A0A8S1J5U6_9CHLO|nr:unnamed protein product [Ostreobium quekettii]
MLQLAYARMVAGVNVVKYHKRLMELGMAKEGYGTPVLAMSLLDRFMAARAASEQGQINPKDVEYLGWAAHWAALKHASSAYGLGKWMAEDLEQWAGMKQDKLREFEVILLLGLGEEKPNSDGGSGEEGEGGGREWGRFQPWSLERPTSYAFIEPFLAVMGIPLNSDQGKFAENALMTSLFWDGMAAYAPSMIAASAAFMTLKWKTPDAPYPDNLQKVSSYSQEDLADCLAHMENLHRRHSRYREGRW